MAEHQLPKLTVRVRFPSPAPGRFRLDFVLPSNWTLPGRVGPPERSRRVCGAADALDTPNRPKHHRCSRRGPNMRLRLLATSLLALGVLAPSGSTSFAATATVPRPDHIVIVIDENHSESDVIGKSAAPYINSLAAKGANFTHSFGVTHPSMPNYLALFSGSTPGTTHEGCPQTWNKPNLATALAAAGLRFIGYSEGLPKAGYTGCGSRQYSREHNPWVDFTN